MAAGSSARAMCMRYAGLRRRIPSTRRNFDRGTKPKTRTARDRAQGSFGARRGAGCGLSSLYLSSCPGRGSCRSYHRNDTDGVTIEIEGGLAQVDEFRRPVPRREPPPLARIDAITVRSIAPTGDTGFRIVASEVLGRVSTGIPADAATCADCLRELLSPPTAAIAILSQLHQLRPALHHHPTHSLRPPADLHGALQNVPRLPGRVRRPGQPPLPRAAQRLLGLRPASADGPSRIAKCRAPSIRVLRNWWESARTSPLGHDFSRAVKDQNLMGLSPGHDSKHPIRRKPSDSCRRPNPRHQRHRRLPPRGRRHK